MRKPLIGLFASTMIVFAACQGAATPSPTSSTTPPASQAPGGSGAAPSGSGAATGDIPDLTHSNYKPADGPDGGQIIIGDWQEANQFNPWYAGQVTEANVLSATTSTLVVLTNDYKYKADLAKDIPTTANGGVKVPGTAGD